MAKPSSSFAFLCGHCRQPLRAQAQSAGQRFRCAHCHRIGRVPSGAGGSGMSGPAHASGERELAAADFEPVAANVFNFRRQRKDDDGLDMTPMVDVTFLLLIFFMITASFALQKSLEMPSSDKSESVAQQRTIEELEQDDDYLIVRIDQDNVIWINEHEAPTRHELLAQLRDARESGAQAPAHLLVYAHGNALHDTVVMVLDVGNALGFEHVRLATEESD